MLYNMQTQMVNLTGPTVVTSKDGTVIHTTQGSYDLKNGNAIFANRTTIKDSSGRTYQADNIAIDEKSGIAQLEGNGIINDSANRLIVTGNEIYLNKKSNSFLATKKPVMIVIQDKDSTYIAADTLFSGYTTTVSGNNLVPVKDSAKKEITKKDSIQVITIVPNLLDSSHSILTGKDSMPKTKIINRNKTDTSVRYLIAFHHVRIFSDSLQSICDSLFYSGADSVFRLFQEPVIWSSKSQVTGDTIYLFTKNKKAKRLYVFENGMIINNAGHQLFNQMQGKTINGYFVNGEIDYMRVKGSPAESVYYVQDNDSAYVGMNRATGDVIDLYFEKQDLKKVLFVNKVSGVLHPMKQIPPDQKYLKNFNWQDKKRPKNKLELFE